MMTNIEFLKKLMERSPYGDLSQLVIMTAVDNYTKHLASMSEAEIEAAFGSNMMVNGAAWQNCCKWVQQELDER